MVQSQKEIGFWLEAMDELIQWIHLRQVFLY